MKYVGIQTQQRRNNLRSMLLLTLFPCLVIGLTYLFCFLAVHLGLLGEASGEAAWSTYSVNNMFIQTAPYALGGVLLWFAIAYFSHAQIIRNASGSRPLERKDNKRVYNLVENLCMSQGMKTPKINIIDDDSLNAFASGINEKSYTVTLSSGIIRKLDDDELEGVIAHELSHIRNRDVRLLIVSIVFVGIFAMLSQICFRMILHAPRTSSRRQGKDSGASIIIIMLLALVVAIIGYFFSTLMRFAISRKREYLADAGAAGMTKKPYALAGALRKISADPDIEAVEREDVAQLFIEHPGRQAHGFLGGLGGLFSTHPPIGKRIEILEQF
ncbi:MAG: M48 family metallopeptidase [Tannerellaceae bacterium]|jgi:heat shock protein HtpX|nr:M48 family metallopeptidase [Tannerellaceae bacterium]